MFCKQKTAYESEYGLVGSEMCIRDSFCLAWPDGKRSLFARLCQLPVTFSTSDRLSEKNAGHAIFFTALMRAVGFNPVMPPIAARSKYKAIDKPPALSERRASQRPFVTVVIPAYNEVALLARHLAVLFGYLHRVRHKWRFEVLLINDGSRDGTGEVAERLCATYPDLKVIHHPTNFGLGQALKTGFAASSGDYVITLDIDLSYAVTSIGDLLEAIVDSPAKMVLASPYMIGGKTTRVPRLRLILSRWANKMFSLLSGSQLSTFTCMVRAYDGPFIRALEPRSQGMGVMPEIVYKTMALGGHIKEVPAHLDWTAQLCIQTQTSDPTDGTVPARQSSMRLLTHIAATIVSGFVFRPFVLLMAPGITALLGALALSAWLLISAGLDNQAFGSVFSEHPVVSALTVILALLAAQLLGMGAVSLQTKKYHDETYFQIVNLRSELDGQRRALQAKTLHA